jgi:hypothetical protein
MVDILMNRQRLSLTIAALVMIVAAVACNLNVKMPSAPQPPIPSLVPSAGEADAFEQSFENAVSQASQTGTFNVVVSQNQFSSWLSLRAPDYAKQQGYDWPLKDVQASLDNGKIRLYGVLVRENVPDTPAQVVFTPTIDATGSLAVSIDSGQVGIMGVPTSVLESLTKTIKDTLDSQLAQIQGHYKLTTLTISGGNLNVTGQIIP